MEGKAKKGEERRKGGERRGEGESENRFKISIHVQNFKHFDI